MGDSIGEPLMGSPVTATHFLLSFTSYNQDITSDYRHGFTWQNSKVSLLGYNQIILYSSSSVSYYPAPGPSFFNTDIRKHNPLITHFPPLANHINVTRDVSIELKTRTTCSYKVTHYLLSTEIVNVKSPIYGDAISIGPYWSKTAKNARKDTKCQNCEASPLKHNNKHQTRQPNKHYLIMEISVCGEYAVITAVKHFIATPPYITTRLSKSRRDLTKKSKDPRQAPKQYRNNNKNLTPEDSPTNEGNYPHNYAIMVISTRGTFAVIKLGGTKLSNRSFGISKCRRDLTRDTKDHRLTLKQCKGDNKVANNEPTSKGNHPHNYVIMVISTRGVSAVITIINDRGRNTRKSSRVTKGHKRGTTFRDSGLTSSKGHNGNTESQLHKNSSLNYLSRTSLTYDLIRLIKVPTTKQRIYRLRDTAHIWHLDSIVASECRPERPNTGQPWHSGMNECQIAVRGPAKKVSLRRPARSYSARLIIENPNIGRWLARNDTRNSNYLRQRKNRYLTYSKTVACAPVDNWQLNTEKPKGVATQSKSLCSTKNRYFTEYKLGNRKDIELFKKTASPAPARRYVANYLGAVRGSCGRSAGETENKQSTTAERNESMKTMKEEMEQKSGSFRSNADSDTLLPHLSLPPNLISPLVSPDKALANYKIPKRVAPEIRIVPLPREVRPKQTYANSSKAKPKKPAKLPNVELIRKRDPRVTKRHTPLYNIPLGARNEFHANEEHVKWIDEIGVPGCQELIYKSEAVLKEIELERETIANQLEAIKALQGEEEYRKACYDICSSRMRTDNKRAQVQRGRHQQLKTLIDLKKTRQKLITRNQKLYSAAKRAFAKPIPLLPATRAITNSAPSSPSFNTSGKHTQPVQPNQEAHQVGRGKSSPSMKPKGSNSSHSSMEAESQGKEQGTVSKSLINLMLVFTTSAQATNPQKEYRNNLPCSVHSIGNHNASDTFFDADATVIDSDGGSTSASSPSVTMESGTQETESDPNADAEAAAPATELSKMMNQLGAPKPIPEAVKRDLDQVSAAVIKAGGLMANRPQENKERKGQVLEMEDVDMDLGELEPLIERPEESTLQRIDFKDLLPPASSTEVPSDFQFDPTLPEYVREQKIEFLLVQKATDDKAWSFPTEETMHQIWNHVRNKLDSDYILDVCLWCRFEKSTSITSLMLSTVNLPVMEEVRHEIRKYHEIVGMRFETYNKTLFIKRYGISMYLPKEQAGLSPQRVLRALFYKHRDIYTRNVKLLSKHRFETNPPGYQIGQRSRIGNAILLFDSTELAEKLKPYDEDFKFNVSKGFTVTLRGGVRGEGHQCFSADMTSKVLVGATDQAMRHAVGAHSRA